MIDNASDISHGDFGVAPDVAAMEVHEALMASCKMLDIAEITDPADRRMLLPAMLQANFQYRLVSELEDLNAALAKYAAWTTNDRLDLTPLHKKKD